MVLLMASFTALTGIGRALTLTVARARLPHYAAIITFGNLVRAFAALPRYFGIFLG